MEEIKLIENIESKIILTLENLKKLKELLENNEIEKNKETEILPASLLFMASDLDRFNKYFKKINK
jgi:hypothetical protein